MTVGIAEAGQGRGRWRTLRCQSSFIYLYVYGLRMLRIFIRLEAKLQPNTEGRVSAAFMRSAVTPPKVNRFR